MNQEEEKPEYIIDELQNEEFPNIKFKDIFSLFSRSSKEYVEV